VTNTSNAELSLTETTPAPEPAPASSLEPEPAHNKAVKRCCAVSVRSSPLDWKYVFNKCPLIFKWTLVECV
jgi:hypothetical protein